MNLINYLTIRILIAVLFKLSQKFAFCFDCIRLVITRDTNLRIKELFALWQLRQFSYDNDY